MRSTTPPRRSVGGRPRLRSPGPRHAFVVGSARGSDDERSPPRRAPSGPRPSRATRGRRPGAARHAARRPSPPGVKPRCTRGDSNPQAYRRRNLKPVRIPIPPLVRADACGTPRQPHQAGKSVCCVAPNASGRGRASGPDMWPAVRRAWSNRRIGGPRRPGGAANLGWPVRTNRPPTAKDAVGKPTGWGGALRRGGEALRREREMGTAAAPGSAGQPHRQRRSNDRVAAENRGNEARARAAPPLRHVRCEGGTVRGRGCCR